MKNILLFLLLFICSTSFGQMGILKEKLTIGGRDFWCKKYIAKVPSNNWIIWLPGIGELGPADGSQLDKVDLFSGTTPVSWTAQASKGYEFPFNILAVQLPTGFDYWAIQNSIAIYVKETLKANEIGITGYSLGGRGAWYCLQGDSKGYINFIAPVCGYYDFSQGPISNLRTVPVYSVHGDKDTTMPYSYDVSTQTAYNIGRPMQIILNQQQPTDYLHTIPGVAHPVWPYAYDVTPGNDWLLQWVIQQFGPEQTLQDPVIKTIFDGSNIIETTQSGKVITIKPATVN